MNNRPLLAALLIDTLDDFDRSIENLTSLAAEKRLPGFSSIGWIVAHMAQHLDSWVVVSLAGNSRNEFIANLEFNFGGSGPSLEWAAIKQEYAVTLTKSRHYLEAVNEAPLSKESLYEGSLKAVRGKTITGNYRLAKLITHLYYHIGEITTIRSAMGHEISVFPGPLPTILESRSD